MAILRTYAEVKKLDPTEVEQQLIDACRAGEPCELAWDVPTEPSVKRTIRADILRYLILGGCEECPVDGRGVNLFGGYITGMLDLNFATAKGATLLRYCCFDSQFYAIQTHFEILNLSGSTLKGFNAQGAQINGDVFLHSITATATVSLHSATIGGQLACEGAKLNATKGIALNAQRAQIKGGVFLRKVTTTATVDLNGATIGGQLSCYGAQITTVEDDAISASNVRISGGVFLHPLTQKEKDRVETPFYATGEVRFNGATLGGVYAQQITLVATSSGQTLSLGGATVNGAVRLDGCDSTGEILLAGSRISGRLTCERIKIRNENGHAFNGQAMRVEHSFVWKKVEHTSGGVSLNGAHVAELNDDPDNWPKTDDLFLDGFTYDRIKGTVSTSPARMGWLESGSFFNREFRPQPYFQYAKFLRETGHDGEARRVLETAEGLLRQDRRRRWRDPRDTPGLNDLQWHWKKLVAWADEYSIDPSLKWVIGYGHAPFRVIHTMTSLIGLCWILTAITWHLGQFAPNSAVIQVSQGWETVQDHDNPAKIWSETGGGGADWESFNAFAYAMDVVIPIINFGQTEAWAPSTTRGRWGWWLWWTKWFFGLAGWIVTALGAAAITGIIRRE
ncbi:MAG: hypothetical protein ABJP79_07840 [Tateyamaria sp.]|uniref:hypothetical protein n=1 Tax=Tateyamaria sp. TaxID=1929288 RepID=UPI00329C585E